MPQYNNANVDETVLAESLEGIPEIGHYYEIVYTTDSYPAGFTFSVFPAIRVLFRSGTYTVARCYIGSQEYSDVQSKVVGDAYLSNTIVDYTRIYPKGWGEVSTD